MPRLRLYANPAERQRAQRERDKAAVAAQLAQKGLPPLPAIPTMPGKVRWRAMLASATEMAEVLRDEMQGYHDERTESWQEGEAGSEFSDRLALLEEAIAALEGVDLA
jgi:hypothetical protein